MNTSVLQYREILLGSRIFIHACIHGRRQEHGGLSGQHGGGEQVVGYASCCLGYDVGSSWNNEHQVCQIRQGNVLHIVLLYFGPHVLSYWLAADFPKGQLRNELRSLPGHHHMDFRPGLPQTAHHFHCLVGGNAPGDPHHDFLAFQKQSFHGLRVQSCRCCNQSCPRQSLPGR